ncbi:MAG: nucleoside triphosphate pyrophosphohydrolase [Bdellovibrionaceae bacterium]|nr:nucleoside triphosphate pyrophosphohydrolase [Pseudobdellovibrionaceae bacterium]
MIQPPNDLRRFESILKIVEALRGPDGCPWDKEQTHRTLTPYAIEEAHELAEAIENGDEPEMISELGDLLLQVVLQAEIGRQSGRFDIHDVIEAISTKMVRRHPHVFNDTQVGGSEDVLRNWAEIKKQEKAAAHRSTTGSTASAIERFDVPENLPALSRAHKIGAKTKAHRFDWPDWQGVFAKVNEELAELQAAIATGSAEEKEAELGDLLFSVAQLARHLAIEPEQALRTTNRRFEQRFFTMRRLAETDGHNVDELSEEQLEAYWIKAKAALKGAR